jgi:hypothetical protein
MFICPIASSGHIYSIHYSGFQQSCHIAPFLRLLILNICKRIAISSSPRRRACGICDRLNEWHPDILLVSVFCLRCQRRTVFVPRASSLALLFPKCSALGLLISGATTFCGRAPSLCLLRLTSSSHRCRSLPWGLDGRSRFSLMGSPGTCPCEAIHLLAVALHTGGVT